MMIGTYNDFVAVLEVEIEKLRDAEDYLNDQGQLLLRAYRKIRRLTAFAESCQELILAGVYEILNPEEEEAACMAIATIARVAQAEETEKNRGRCAKSAGRETA